MNNAARRVLPGFSPRTNLLAPLFRFIKSNVVFVIAVILAAATSVIVLPDAEYLGYFDFKTLSCLFCTLAVVCALKNIRFFTILAQKIVAVTGNTRSAVLTLLFITLIGSMLIANDMALLTFLPLGYFVLSSTGNEKHMAFTFIMQNIAANLGGMLTPFGNPQNLYLYTKFNIPNGEFVTIMLVPFLLSIVLITVTTLIFVKKEPLAVPEKSEKPLPKGRTAIYLVMFAASIAMVFGVIPYQICLIAIPALLMFFDRDALKKVDYCLLLTFVAFFIFAGNMSRIEAVRGLLSGLLEQSTLLVSTFSCQFISNVPSAILLSQFTDNYRALLIGVNIGGTGTLIASLASLITFREFTSRYKEKTGSYMLLFTALNFAFLAILLVVSMLLV